MGPGAAKHVRRIGLRGVRRTGANLSQLPPPPSLLSGFALLRRGPRLVPNSVVVNQSFRDPPPLPGGGIRVGFLSPFTSFRSSLLLSPCSCLCVANCEALPPTYAIVRRWFCDVTNRARFFLEPDDVRSRRARRFVSFSRKIIFRSVARKIALKSCLPRNDGVTCLWRSNDVVSVPRCVTCWLEMRWTTKCWLLERPGS